MTFSHESDKQDPQCAAYHRIPQSRLVDWRCFSLPKLLLALNWLGIRRGW